MSFVCRGESEETMLPCEFCESLFPSNQLAFHQVSCITTALYAKSCIISTQFQVSVFFITFYSDFLKNVKIYN